VVPGPLQWQIWSEPVISDLPKITSLNPIEQLKITDDNTIYLWYRHNVTLKQASANTIIRVQTRIANALLFFLNGQFLGEFENHEHTTGPLDVSIAVDLSHFKPNQPYLFDHLVREDTNANPILLDALDLNRGHAFVNGNDLGLYWLIQGICQPKTCCCQQAQINCLQPTQRYYHIPSDWLMPKNNLITIFDDLGVPSPGSVNLVQRVVTK
jgi:hypothetical protein